MIEIFRRNTHMEVHGLSEEQIPQLTKRYSLYDNPTFKYIEILSSVDKDNAVRLYGRCTDTELWSLYKVKPVAKLEFDEFDDIFFKMKNKPKNNDQLHLIDFLCGNLNFSYTRAHPQLLVNVDTAFGKTFCTIHALLAYMAKFIIIVPTKPLVDNWIEEILKHTNMTLDDIEVVTPTTYNKLISGDIDLSSKSAFITTHSTINSIADNDWTKVGDLFKRLRVGTKVFDEVHKNFRNVVLTDLYTDTNKTIYLSATVKRSNIKENLYINKFFYGMLYFGKDDIEKRGDRYIKGVVFNIKTLPTDKEKKSFICNRKGSKGMTPTLFAKYLCDKRYNAIEAIVYKAVDTFNRRKYRAGKLLILISNNKAQDKIYKTISDKYPDSTIKIINGKTKMKDREFDTDIIISSTMIMGTGVNIPDLVQVLMLDAYSSAIIAEQIPNRLRKIEGVTQIYMEVVDQSILESTNQFKNRYKTLSNQLQDILYVNMKPTPGKGMEY